MQEFKDLLSDVKEQNNNVVELFNKNNCQEGVVLQEPPDNFRCLSVIPTVNDIKEMNVFIRPNIVEGKYANTEHYLDVQFRLLREDYMRPLRLGIQQYLYLLAAGQLNLKNLKQIQDMKFYQDFKVLYPIFDKNGIFYLASFDISLFSHVNWECTKRFMTGSLICFSNDNFDSIVFASIAQRDAKLLKQGMLIIKLEESSSEGLICGLSNSCIMVETEAYFEAYRHNLAALKQMNNNNMPFQDYIVHVEKDIKHPSYLNTLTRYNMFLTNVPVLMSDKWPSKEKFGFDDTQYEAFKAAITKEFSIIQGPPGTGKTFIALKITEMLLQNKYCMSSRSPILVVCYTNHALDQFLEGILSYTQKVGRVGGRCQNENLEPYQLKNLRSEERKFSNTSQPARKVIGKTYAELCRYVEAMDQYSNKFDACVSNILQDELLFNIMSKNHYYSLFSIINNIGSYDGNLIKDWLAIRSNEVSQMSLQQDKTFFDLQSELNASINLQNYSTEVSTSESGKDTRDSEADFIEGIRMIDDDDNISVQLKALQLEDKEDVPKTKEEWRTHSRKNKNKFIRQKLKSTKAMMCSEACKVTDVWQLTLEKRWSLYMHWVECFMKQMNQDIVETKEHILRLQERLQGFRNEEDAYILEQCDIIGITTTGAAKYKNIIKKLKPQIVIFEEAAEVLEAHIVTSLTEHTKHVILIGDHQQLRPNPTVYELAKKFNFDVSLFERMVKNGLECHKLTFQHRMRPSIASLLVPHIYPDLKNHQSVFSYPNIKGMDKNMFFINHNVYETENTEMKSHANKHEAKFILALATYLIKQGYQSTQITILTTYSGQLFLLKELRKDKLLTDVRITIVDNYQGEENDIILISFVRSNIHGGVGFLKISNRVCVALSRAKQGLYCIGNFELLGNSCNLWKEIQAKLVVGENIGNALKLNCQLHPETSVKVSTAEDFKNVPDGGCLRLCGRKLLCGHVCAKKCHPTDLDHMEYQSAKKSASKIYFVAINAYLLVDNVEVTFLAWTVKQKLLQMLPVGIM
ncbi:NFX1-type zinc finger-containing protein 1-like [Uloborus diversus]|uniref:NFX1-type zinc finger-containing protein 1-like n=1 Tax=Uloborus diversus TaxID=327109 RepID=UPI0024099D13|nr:NFX1-type zinc finger-containing protein 1-like [Uloborus diversus]